MASESLSPSAVDSRHFLVDGIEKKSVFIPITTMVYILFKTLKFPLSTIEITKFFFGINQGEHLD